MAQVRGYRRRLRRLRRQSRVGIRIAPVRVVAALRALEVHFRITAASARGRRRTVLGHHASVRRPGADQRAIHREVLSREQSRLARPIQHPLEQLPHHLVLDQPVAVLAVGRVIPRRALECEPHEPAIQQVVPQLLAQQPLAAQPVQCLQQQPAQQLLGRDRLASRRRIHRLERPVHLLQRRDHDLANRAQRMRLGHERLGRHVVEQSLLRYIGSAHRARILPAALNGPMTMNCAA